MTAAEPLAGVHYRPGFLDASTLERVRAAMAAGAIEQAEVLGDGISPDQEVRSVANIEVDGATLGLVEDLLDQHRETVAGNFGVTLTSREGASFLRYPPGGLYRPHRDRAVVASWPDAARRLVAVVVFLNSSRAIDVAGGFDGGVLRLFADGEAPFVEVHPRAGTLVAFRADRLHEVTPVRHGTRETIVDWYYE